MLDLGQPQSIGLWLRYTGGSGGTTGATSDHSDSMTWREFDMYFRTASTRTDRYIRITFHDTVTASHSWSAGRVMIGLSSSLTRTFNYGWRRRRCQVNRSKRSDLGARTVNMLYQYFQFVFSFTQMTAAEALVLTNFTDSLVGDGSYLFLIPDTSDYNGYIVRLDTPSVEETFDFYRGVGELVFTEESRGTRIGA